MSKDHRRLNGLLCSSLKPLFRAEANPPQKIHRSLLIAAVAHRITVITGPELP